MWDRGRDGVILQTCAVTVKTSGLPVSQFWWKSAVPFAVHIRWILWPHLLINLLIQSYIDWRAHHHNRTFCHPAQFITALYGIVSVCFRWHTMYASSWTWQVTFATPTVSVQQVKVLTGRANTLLQCYTCYTRFKSPGSCSVGKAAPTNCRHFIIHDGIMMVNVTLQLWSVFLHFGTPCSKVGIIMHAFLKKNTYYEFLPVLHCLHGDAFGF